MNRENLQKFERKLEKKSTFRAFASRAKGQLISKCPLGVIVWTKIPTKKLPRFLPKPLRRGQIKNFIEPIMLTNP